MTSYFVESNNTSGFNITSINYDDLHISDTDEQFRQVVSYMELYSVPVIFIAGEVILSYSCIIWIVSPGLTFEKVVSMSDWPIRNSL